METDNTIMAFCHRVESLPDQDRLQFYESFSLQLTVAIRLVLWDTATSEGEKIKRIDLINEILHKSIGKITVLRRRIHEWSEPSFWAMVTNFVGREPAISTVVEYAMNEAYAITTNMGLARDGGSASAS